MTSVSGIAISPAFASALDHRVERLVGGDADRGDVEVRMRAFDLSTAATIVSM